MREDRRSRYDDGFRRPDGMAGDAPVRQVDQQAHVRPAPADMGWQYQHQWWRDELERLGIRQSMSRKGNCLDNAATEQVFGHLKEFYRGRGFDSYERFKHELDARIVHWNTRRRQIRLEGHTLEEFRSMSLAV